MLEHSISHRAKSKTKVSYTDHMKEVSLYMYSVAGRIAYETLQRNLPGIFPSTSCVRTKLARKERMKEGRFRFTEIKEKALQRKENLYVVVSEDDTKVEERLRYDYEHDEIMGLQLPLNSRGMPKEGQFKFTTLKHVREFIRANPACSYAKLMTVTTIGEKSSVYTLVVYGTAGSDKAIDVYARWNFIYKAFQDIGVTVVCKYLDSTVSNTIMTLFYIFRLQRRWSRCVFEDDASYTVDSAADQRAKQLPRRVQKFLLLKI